jgi:anti-sigma regulatory factor (Ser/Thr protein kinase)
MKGKGRAMGQTDDQQLDNGEIMMWRRVFPGHADQTREARQFVEFLLRGHSKCDDIVEVTSELFGNGVRHSLSAKPGGRLALEVRRWSGCCATVSITDDGGRTEPVEAGPIDLDDPDSLPEGGLGLHLVASLSTCWGWHGDVNGRTFCAIFMDD